MERQSPRTQPEPSTRLNSNRGRLGSVVSDVQHVAAALDLQLLHALHIDGRASFGLLGRVLGVSDHTAARRYARLRSASGLRVAAEGPLGHKQWYVPRAHHPGHRDDHRSRRRAPPRHRLGASGLRRHRDRVFGTRRRRRARAVTGEAAAHLLRAGRERPKRAARSHSQRSPTASSGRCPDHDPAASAASRQPPPTGPGTGNAQRARTTHLDKLDQALLAVLRDDARQRSCRCCDSPTLRGSSTSPAAPARSPRPRTSQTRT